MSTDELIGVYEGICGVKTGTTIEAGYCFAGAVSRDEGEFYSVVLGSPDSDARFADTVTLFDWMYGNIVEQRLINADSSVDYQGSNAPCCERRSYRMGGLPRAGNGFRPISARPSPLPATSSKTSRIAI
ncbi:MAG: hypothetical protein ACLT98_08485 [Eggerthellaceae bacterium]